MYLCAKGIEFPYLSTCCLFEHFIIHARSRQHVDAFSFAYLDVIQFLQPLYILGNVN